MYNIKSKINYKFQYYILFSQVFKIFIIIVLLVRYLKVIYYDLLYGYLIRGYSHKCLFPATSINFRSIANR